MPKLSRATLRLLGPFAVEANGGRCIAVSVRSKKARALLSEAGGRRIAVIVNEFGDAGFDGGLVEECAANACAPGDIVELTNGCICCTVRGDLVRMCPTDMYSL